MGRFRKDEPEEIDVDEESAELPEPAAEKKPSKQLTKEEVMDLALSHLSRASQLLNIFMSM